MYAMVTVYHSSNSENFKIFAVSLFELLHFGKALGKAKCDKLTASMEFDIVKQSLD